MKKPIWKIGILCLICLTLLGGCLLYYMKIETEKKYEEEVQMLLYHKVDIALNFGMYGTRGLSGVGRNMFNKTEMYENVFLYADEELAEAAVERGEIGERDVYAYATETTLKRLEALNLFIERDNLADKLDTYDLEYPITMDDLINKTESFWQFVNDRSLLSQSEYNVITRR